MLCESQRGQLVKLKLFISSISSIDEVLCFALYHSSKVEEIRLDVKEESFKNERNCLLFMLAVFGFQELISKTAKFTN